jgi:hypothetical protein
MTAGPMTPRDARAPNGWFCRLVLLLAQQEAQILRELWQRLRRFLRGRMCLLWVSGRPVLFLTALCLLVGTFFLAVSFALSAAFFIAGICALGLALRMLEPLADAVAE